eukprot:GEMP01028723.1.p1 GENE.GEMP01028723.1~~GEMP01028723.1.p1  ORF type:complete len:281 (+),score=45.40 GEMP01028723.1:115-957(+)
MANLQFCMWRVKEPTILSPSGSAGSSGIPILQALGSGHTEFDSICGSNSGSNSPMSRCDNHESLFFERWRDGLMDRYLRVQDAFPQMIRASAGLQGDRWKDNSIGKSLIISQAQEDGRLIVCDLHIEGPSEGPLLNQAVRQAFTTVVPGSTVYCTGTAWGDFEVQIVLKKEEEMDEAIAELQEESSCGGAKKLLTSLVCFLPDHEGHLRLTLDPPMVMSRTMIMIEEEVGANRVSRNGAESFATDSALRKSNTLPINSEISDGPGNIDVSPTLKIPTQAH